MNPWRQISTGPKRLYAGREDMPIKFTDFRSAERRQRQLVERVWSVDTYGQLCQLYELSEREIDAHQRFYPPFYQKIIEAFTTAAAGLYDQSEGRRINFE